MASSTREVSRCFQAVHPQRYLFAPARLLNAALQHLRNNGVPERLSLSVR
jgi:hypothetical protein